jgi:predicted aspartyl protease
MKTEAPEMGRVVVEFVVANNRDVVNLFDGGNVLGKVKHATVSGVVDSGATRLVLPQRVVDELQLMVDSEQTVRFADNRQIVSNVWLQMLGRHGIFSAVVEPNRDDALIGAIVLEELDLLVDCGTQSVYPREADGILTEIE